jgi:hypothetical protein
MLKKNCGAGARRRRLVFGGGVFVRLRRLLFTRMFATKTDFFIFAKSEKMSRYFPRKRKFSFIPIQTAKVSMALAAILVTSINMYPVDNKHPIATRHRYLSNFVSSPLSPLFTCH